MYIQWLFGKKSLNSDKANYSFGSLQEILEEGVSHVDVTEVDSVLILGMGAGSIIQSLREKFNYKGKIEAVEIDKKIIEIAKEEFDIKPGKNLFIYEDDAFVFVQKCRKKYDFIIVDLFIDDEVPRKFYSFLFWENVERNIRDNGTVLFNAGMKESSQKEIQQLYEKITKKFKIRKIRHSIYKNVLWLLHRKNKE